MHAKCLWNAYTMHIKQTHKRATTAKLMTEFMPNLCQTYADPMPHSCQLYDNLMPIVCQMMPKLCTNYSELMPVLCQTYARNPAKLMPT